MKIKLFPIRGWTLKESNLITGCDYVGGKAQFDIGGAPSRRWVKLTGKDTTLHQPVAQQRPRVARSAHFQARRHASAEAVGVGPVTFPAPAVEWVLYFDLLTQIVEL